MLFHWQKCFGNCFIVSFLTTSQLSSPSIIESRWHFLNYVFLSSASLCKIIIIIIIIIIIQYSYRSLDGSFGIKFSTEFDNDFLITDICIHRPGLLCASPVPSMVYTLCIQLMLIIYILNNRLTLENQC